MLARIGSEEEGPLTWGPMSRKKDAIASDLIRSKPADVTGNIF
jgi:hypothetical protein